MEIVERAPLVEQWRVGRIEIFRHAIPTFQDAPAESDHPPTRVLYRQHNAMAKAIVGGAIIGTDTHTAFHQHRVIEPGQGGWQRLFAFGGIAKAEFTQGFRLQPAIIQIPRRRAARAAVQIVHEPVLRLCRHIDQFCALLGLFRGNGIGGGDFHTGFRRQLLHRVDERQSALFRHPADDIAMRAAAEAVIELFLIIDVEAGRLLVVERAASLPFPPRLGELGRAQDHGRQRDPRAQLVFPLRGDAHE